MQRIAVKAIVIGSSKAGILLTARERRATTPAFAIRYLAASVILFGRIQLPVLPPPPRAGNGAGYG